MVIHKIFNNNVAVILDENGNEQIVMGRGIAFSKKCGDEIDQKIDKVFKLSNKEINSKFQELLMNIPSEHVVLADKIIQYGKTKLGKKLNESIYISLSDHISTAVIRFQSGIIVKNALYWETKRFYQDEFYIGTAALKMIKDELGIQLPEDEAGFIALHFVNAQLDEQTPVVNEVTKVMLEIENMVKYIFGIEFDEESVYFYRFITHLKFFAQRLFTGKDYRDEQEDDLLGVIKLKYKNAYDCVERVSKFIYEKYGYILSDEEILYLTIHVARIVGESQKKNHKQALIDKEKEGLSEK